MLENIVNAVCRNVNKSGKVILEPYLHSDPHQNLNILHIVLYMVTPCPHLPSLVTSFVNYLADRHTHTHGNHKAYLFRLCTEAVPPLYRGAQVKREETLCRPYHSHKGDGSSTESLRGYCVTKSRRPKTTFVNTT